MEETYLDPETEALNKAFVNGNVAIKYYEQDHKKIESFLQTTFPKDTARFIGICKYYIANYSKKTWQGVDRIHDRVKAVTITELCGGKK